MPIIGKLLKKTNAITYRRNLKKNVDLENQLQTLEKLLTKAKKTRFGQFYKFADILNSEDLSKDFQQNVPITDYDTFHKDWLSTTMQGTKDHTWPGRIRHYALSSGTTGSPSKRIPITNQMIDSFQKSTVKQISTLHELNLPDKFYNGQILVVGGSSKLVKMENHLEGDLSGILKKYTPFFVSTITKPGSKITKQSDWNVKIDMMVEKASEWNISVIAGVPSWCILLMERIIAHYDVDSIHDIWPNLDVYAHGGVFLEPYIPRLERVLERKINLIDTYLASEGYFAYQKHPAKKGMQLLLNSGIFFEFIPFNSDYFDREGELIDTTRAFSIDEVQPDIDYAIVISTNAGLWRYLIGDLVRFTDIEQREIIITGRIKQFLSLCGEHLSLDNINQAIINIAKRNSIEINEFTIYANEEKLNHHWFLGTNNEIDAEDLMQKIDAELKILNDDYRSSRKVNLNNPNVTVIPVAKFYQFMEAQGKLGSQHKFPRVMNKKQSEDWLKFLKESGTLKKLA
jgi:hypothetical protein